MVMAETFTDVKNSSGSSVELRGTTLVTLLVPKLVL